jgi:hypothetical protein
MKVFLDDIRQPKDCLSYMKSRLGDKVSIYDSNWVIVRNFEEFADFVSGTVSLITHISFDYDLADEHYEAPMYNGNEEFEKTARNFDEKTGYDCAIWMKDFYDSYGLDYPIMYVHSMNPIGTQKIINLFK